MRLKRFLGMLVCAVLLLTAVFALGACDDPVEPNPGDEHKCESKCPTCGKCTDAACTEDACKEKCPGHDDPVKPEVKSDTLYVKKVEGLPDDFVMGMDASAVISLEKSGVKYYDFDGKETDVFKILADNGINTIRVRVWNNPFDDNGNGFGGGNCDINVAEEIGKRATKYGMGLMVDFHYSDFWADPAKQRAPRAWADMKMDMNENDKKPNALYEYTKACLQQLADAKVKVTMVQVGNETNGKMAGEDVWQYIAKLMNAGSKAVREVYPEAQVVLHFANPEKVSNYKDYAKKLQYWGVDYDVFGSSYYPYWHGTLENLQTLLSEIATTYDKKVMVAETSYAFTGTDYDFGGNTIGDGGAVTKNYPYTLQGQTNCMRDVIDTVVHTTNGIGVCYWEGTWVPVGTNSWEENSALWEKYGSGWASSYASIYDPDVKKYGGGGTQVDNQTFFDAHGKVLESIKVFALVKNGNIVENKPDALEDITIICDLNGKIELPTKVNAVMRDDSKQELDVKWNITDADYDKMYNGGVQKYDITGDADGMTAHCYVSMVEKNFLNNYSFEDDDNKTKQPSGGWVVTDNDAANELWVEDKATDSLTGDKHYHFWKNSGTVNFDLEQELKDLTAGKYKFSMSIMGGDVGESNIYIYVKINGEVVKTQAMTITSYGNWDTQWIEDIVYDGTSTIVVGIHMECQGTGAGAWGKIDDALFNSVSE